MIKNNLNNNNKLQKKIRPTKKLQISNNNKPKNYCYKNNNNKDKAKKANKQIN